MDEISLPRSDWTPLPARARAMFVLNNVLIFGLIGIAAAVAVFVIFAIGLNMDRLIPVAVALGLIGIGIGIWRGYKVHKNFRWRLDDTGLGIRSGHMWMKDARVPIQRVQHLNLSRGPLQRKRELATLTVFTAGTANSSVKLPNMDNGIAEQIRAYLSERIDWVDE